MKKIVSLALMALILCIQHENHAMCSRIQQATPYIRQAGQRFMSSQPAFVGSNIVNKFPTTPSTFLFNNKQPLYGNKRNISLNDYVMLRSLEELYRIHRESIDDLKKERLLRIKHLDERAAFNKKYGDNSKVSHAVDSGMAFGNNPYYASRRPLGWFYNDISGNQFPGTPEQYEFEKNTSQRLARKKTMLPLLFGSGGLLLFSSLEPESQNEIFNEPTTEIEDLASPWSQ